MLSKKPHLIKKYAKVVEELKAILDDVKMKDKASKDDPNQEPSEKHVRFTIAHVHRRNVVFSTAGAPY